VKKEVTLVILILFISAILFLNPGPIWAGTTGKIAGTVVDAETGEGLPGANVIIEGTILGAAVDLDGYYMILNVPPGVYTLEVMMLSYQTMRVENVRVSIDLTSKVDFKLGMEALVGETVTVVAERPLVRADVTSTQSFVGAEDIEALPVEGVAQILELQAGMVKGHMRGGRASEIAYQIDGNSVTDPYSGEKAVEIENMAIQELQVISGTFNAEYGQAMSGIVNIVTKDGGQKLAGNLSIYSGDYVSKNKNTFYNINNINPWSIFDVQASLDGPLPVLSKKFSFFTSARFISDDGHLYGQRVFNPGDNPLDPLYAGPSGDEAPVSMNRQERLSLQAKLTYIISTQYKLTYGMLWDKYNYRDFINDDLIHSHSHDFKYNPDGDYQRHKKGYNHSLNFKHILNPTTFYTVSFSYLFSDYRYYVFQDPEEILKGKQIDPRYVDPDLLDVNVAANFRSGGTEMWHFNRNTTTMIGKFDIISQITKTHQIKVGIEARKHKLYMHEFELIPKKEQGIEIEPFEPDIPPISSPLHNKYTYNPVEASAYIQDKMEFKAITVNVGVRYDLFDPDGKVPTDLKDPHNDSFELWDFDLDTLITGLDPVQPINDDGSYNYWRYKYKKTKFKHQISPRIGIAFPITSRGVIHFSYGHFFQIPTFEHLYTDPEFEVEKGIKTRMGNADLNPQRTVIYEFGLQQQLSENIGMHITGYYKDIRDLLGTEIHETYISGNKYARYVNRDYGNVRGITIAFDKRSTGYLSASIDYTYQVAEGNASDPNATFWDNQSIPPRESEKQVVPLDWDQTHTLNLSVTLSKSSSWGLSIIGRYGSGLPYSPAYQYQRTGIENSERKPPQYNVDLKTYKKFTLGKVKYSLYLIIYNLFDVMNEVDVYSDTGRAGYTLIRSTGRVIGPLTYDDYYKRPEFYSTPRLVKVGVSVGF
jgi:hypothetical protein